MKAKELKILLDTLIELEGEDAKIFGVEPGRDGAESGLVMVRARLKKTEHKVIYMELLI